MIPTLQVLKLKYRESKSLTHDPNGELDDNMREENPPAYLTEFAHACIDAGCVAEKYGFQYELVQYRWPRWLHQQTEKQRIIWGYKWSH